MRFDIAVLAMDAFDPNSALFSRKTKREETATKMMNIIIVQESLGRGT